ncbi:MAG: nitroreductase/quinone reductase family protein [Candidatus Dormibacteria bacterium]
MRWQVARYRRRRGSGQPTMMGFPALVLTTRGARSGRLRTVPLGGFPDGAGAWLVVASAGGGARHPGWFLNMAKYPEQIWVEVGERKLHVHGESLLGDARAAALQRIAAIAPRYGEYQRKTDREIPVVRLTEAD